MFWFVFFCSFFFSSRRRHTRLQGDWSSDVCSSDLCLFPDTRTGALPKGRALFVACSARNFRRIRTQNFTQLVETVFSLVATAVPGELSAAGPFADGGGRDSGGERRELGGHGPPARSLFHDAVPCAECW